MRVYVVDDDPALRRMIVRMLASAGAECQEFAAAGPLLEALDDLPFGCVLLDVGLPDACGVELLTQIVERRSLPVVMASGSTQMEDAIRSFRSGAVHFLRKPFAQQALLAALAEAEIVGLERQAAAERRAEASRVRLTAREREVLAAMTAGQTSKGIAWSLGLSVRTVDMHRSNILAKLKAKNASQAVSIARTLHLLPEAAHA